MDELTKLVCEYKETGNKLDELTERTAILIYSLLKQRSGIDADDLGDFFCYFYPKIPGLFHRFQYQGKSFRYYLLVSLKWQFRSFMAERRKQKRRRLFLEREHLWHSPYWEDSHSVSEPVSYISSEAKSVLEIDDRGKIGNPVQQKRLLLLTMKGSLHVDTHIAWCVSTITGYTSKWILNCIQKLKETMNKRNHRLEQLRIKRNRYYIRIYDIHIDLTVETDIGKRKVLYEELYIIKRRMELTITEISRIPRAPTHKEIANVMGYPKGTVDSGLYYIKNAFEKMYNPGYTSLN